MAAGLVLGWAAAVAAAAAAPVDLAHSPTLRKIRDAGVITVGYRAASMPFSYLDGQRRPVGYTLDLCLRIVDVVRQRLAQPDLELRMMRLPLVANGTVDLECGVTTHTAERARSVAFSITTFVAASRLLSRKAAPVNNLDDLRGKTVASSLATTSMQHLHAQNQARGLDMTIVGALDDADSFRLVGTGRAAAYAMDDVLLSALMASAGDGADYRISDEALTTEPYAIGLKRGDAVFKRLVDEVLAGLYRSGEIHTLYKRWFQSPLPPRGLNLNLPMSAALRRAIEAPTDSSDPAHYR
jgi:glutamate/aspartate transport system substrate-binding protein